MAPRTKKQFGEMREIKRDLILNTALKLFAENGYHVTSISKIAKEAGISKGLIYNYFESKENILENILIDFINILSAFINPDGDDEITNDEMSDFFDLMINSMIADRNYWIILFQLSMQKDVIAMIFSKNKMDNYSEKLMQLAYKYFADRFEKPEEEMLFFRSILKGFALILVFTPEVCPDDLVNSFKTRLKYLFIKEKR